VNAARRPWANLSLAEKVGLVRPLLEAGETYNAIAAKVRATSRNSIAGIAAKLKSKAALKSPDQTSSPGLVTPAVVRNAAGNNSEKYPDPHFLAAADGQPGKPSRAAFGRKKRGSPALADRGGPTAGHLNREVRQAVTIPSTHTKPWTSLSPREKEAAVLELQAAGLSQRLIAERLGCPEGSVATVARRLAGPVNADRKKAERQEKEAKVLALVAEGFSSAQIARRLGFASRSVVSGIVHRTQGRGMTKASRSALVVPAGSMAWQQMSAIQKNAVVLPLCEKGYSAARIAIALNTSRPAVLGVMKRLRDNGVKVPGSVSFKTTKRGDRVYAPGVLSGLKARNVPAENRPSFVIDRANAFDPLPGTTPVPYGSPGCKFSVDGLHGRGLLWCGRPREDDRPYCSDHCRVAFRCSGVTEERNAA
jgi:hypothetical protein